jgi:hypothetical protein
MIIKISEIVHEAIPAKKVIITKIAEIDIMIIKISAIVHEAIPAKKVIITIEAEIEVFVIKTKAMKAKIEEIIVNEIE